MAKTRPKPHRKTPASQATTPIAPWSRLVTWANELCTKRRCAVTSRLAIATATRLDVYDAQRFTQGLGVVGLFQAAAVLGRTVPDDALVAVLVPTDRTADTFSASTAGGLAHGAAATLRAFSRDGADHGRIWTVRHAPGNMVNIAADDLWPVNMARFENFMSDEFAIDPGVERVLAKRGLPGARADAGEDVPQASPAASIVHVGASVPPPSLPDRGRAIDFEIPDDAWEALHAEAERFLDARFGTLGDVPFVVIPAAAPTGLTTRPLEELLRRGWSGEAQACALAQRFSRERDVIPALRAFLAAPLPERAILYACARAALSASRGGDRLATQFAVEELLARYQAFESRCGGVEAAIARAWPERILPGDDLGTVTIAVAAVAAYWRLVTTNMVAEYPLAPDAPARQAMDQAARLRDAILARAKVEGESAGERIAAIARAVVGGELDEGEFRIERWMKALTQRSERQLPERNLRDHAGIHATILHTITTISEVAHELCGAAVARDYLRIRPDRVATVGLLRRGVEVVAHQIVLRAAHEPEEEERLRLLARATEIAPFDRAILACRNEARVRARRFDDALLVDLSKEESVAAAAEALLVAESMGKKREARVARKRLVDRAGGTAHAWIARARALFGRPDELAKLETVTALAATAPTPDVAVGDRVSRALYGADPAATIAKFTQALAAQREALEWAALVREVRAEEESAAPTGEGLPRPDPPKRAGEGSVDRAIAAARWRLERPKSRRAPWRGAIEAHLRRAAELAVFEDMAGPWIEALAKDGGLVHALDDALMGETSSDASVARALDDAERALDDVFATSWLQSIFARISTARPAMAQGGARADEIARRARAIQEEAGCATQAADRARVESELTQLVADATAAEPPDVEDEEPIAAEGEDAFQPMVLPDAAIVRSREELATPEWALQQGVRQVAFFNAARGRRDLKMLRGTRGDDAGAIWELRHRDGRHPVRVLYRAGQGAPRVIAIIVKDDEADQRRLIERVRAWP